MSENLNESGTAVIDQEENKIPEYGYDREVNALLHLLDKSTVISDLKAGKTPLVLVLPAEARAAAMRLKNYISQDASIAGRVFMSPPTQKEKQEEAEQAAEQAKYEREAKDEESMESLIRNAVNERLGLEFSGIVGPENNIHRLVGELSDSKNFADAALRLLDSDLYQLKEALAKDGAFCDDSNAEETFFNRSEAVERLRYIVTDFRLILSVVNELHSKKAIA